MVAGSVSKIISGLITTSKTDRTTATNNAVYIFFTSILGKILASIKTFTAQTNILRSQFKSFRVLNIYLLKP
jgi:hypothetical protein